MFYLCLYFLPLVLENLSLFLKALQSCMLVSQLICHVINIKVFDCTHLISIIIIVLLWFRDSHKILIALIKEPVYQPASASI